MLKFIICGIILGILLKLLLNVLNNINNNIKYAIEEKERQKRHKEIEEFRKREIEEEEKLREALRQREIKEGLISYRSLYKGANTLKGNCYNFTAQVVQIVGEHIYHVDMYCYRKAL